MKESKKTHTISVRIDPKLKKQAEIILKEIGFSTSKAITLFYKKIIMHKGLPFRADFSYKKPIIEEELTKEELLAEIKKGISSKSIPAKKAIKEIEKEFNL